MTTPNNNNDNNYEPPPPQGKRIIIRNLPPGTSRDELHELGNKYGRVISVEMVPKPDRPFGFISFLSEDDAGFAVYRLNGYRYKNHILEVSHSNSKLPPKQKIANKSKMEDKPKKTKKPIYSLRTLSPANPPTLSPQQNKPSNDSHIIKSWDKHNLSMPSSSEQQPDNGYIPTNDKPANTNKGKRNNQNYNNRKPDPVMDKLQDHLDNAVPETSPNEDNVPNELDQAFPVTEIQINIPPNQIWCSFKLGPDQTDQFLKAVGPFLQVTELH